ncbi:hypothetical protein GYMLUDRAFT_37347 [Collybiopsis luxurians FD-317 M1]|nr:hypothetical protein GYMLUDRAFT_37347 [Collybiopsis luxurians FD-317 M1]
MDRPASKSKKVDGNVTPISNPKNDTRVPARVSASESSDDEDEDEDNTPAVNKPPVSSPASTPKVRDVYAHVDLEELVRGPSNKRLTLDSVLPVAIASSRKHNAVVLEEDPIVKTKPIRKSLPVKASIWSDVDSDDPGSESASASGLAEAESPNPVETSTLPSVLSAKESNMPVSAVPSAIPEVSALPGQVSFVAGTPVNQGTTEWSIQLPDSLKPSLAFGQDYSSRNNAARIEADRESSVPETPTEEHDPIEPVIPSPRPKSPIEPSLPTVDSLSEETRPNTSTFSKPDTIIPVPRWSARKTASQPISKHEAEIRESVVRLTRSRSKQTVHAPNPPGPSSTVIISPSVKRALPASQPVRVTTPGEPDSAVRETNAEPMWTTLNVGSSSAVDADSSHGSDELQSNGGHEMEASAIRRRASAGPLLSSNPLFISSESQVDFPYSQFQDLDVETDTGVQEAISALSRLEEDSEEEEEVEETVIAKSSKHSSTGFRGLSQIASQTFFTGFKSPSVFFSTPKSPKDSDMYGPLSQAYEDDMSDSESELEAEKSHIPKARRAGNKH